MSKNVYKATLSAELRKQSGINAFCKLFKSSADAYRWLSNPHSEKDLIPILRKLGYDIPKEITGRETEKFIYCPI